MTRPLDGVRVLDFTRVYSGPYTTLLLADMGAEVVKVEHPDHGDDSRSYGPQVASTSGYFETLNRGKKSIAIDYRSPEGQDVLRRLVPAFDVVVENYRVGRMKTFGLDYPALQQVNPRLIYTSISGYGQYGDLANLGCYDIVAQAVSGLMSLTGIRGTPLKTGPAIADALTGLTAAVGLLGALYRRTQTGEGGYVDVAMVDSAFAVLENALATYSVTGAAPNRHGNADTTIAPFDAFECGDGWVVIAVGNDRLWKKLVGVVGPFLDRPDFVTNALRLKNYDDLKALLSAWVWPQTTRAVLRKLHKAGIPAGGVRSVDDLAHDAQLEARDMLMKIPLDDDHTVMVPGSPIHISGADRPARVRAPKLGEHTEEILATLRQ